MDILSFALFVVFIFYSEAGSEECGGTHKETVGRISYTRLTNKTEACQWILDISPMTKLRLGVQPISDEFEYEAAIFVYRVNPENENTPLASRDVVTQRNGTDVTLTGTIFIIEYYENKPEGKGFVMVFEGFENTDTGYSFQSHIVRNPMTKISTSSYQFLPNSFTTILARGPIYDNRLASYLKNVILQYFELNPNYGSCILTVSHLSSTPTSSTDHVRSFYGSSKYPIVVETDVFGPIVVTIKRRGDGSQDGINFLLNWSYLS